MHWHNTVSNIPDKAVGCFVVIYREREESHLFPFHAIMYVHKYVMVLCMLDSIVHSL